MVKHTRAYTLSQTYPNRRIDTNWLRKQDKGMKLKTQNERKQKKSNLKSVCIANIKRGSEREKILFLIWLQWVHTSTHKHKAHTHIVHAISLKFFI